jgi:type II secretory pathway pseudopilin PulG
MFNRACQKAQKSGGYTLTEMLVMVLILAVTVTIALPTMGEIRRKVAIRTSTRRVADFLNLCRARAIFRNRRTAAVMRQIGASTWQLSIVEDGNNNGVLSRDMKNNRDVTTDAVIELECGPVRIGFLEGADIPDPSGRGRLKGGPKDPVRGGSSDIITFSPQGTARTCSIYFTDQHSSMRVIRVVGTTGRIRVLEWHQGQERWKRVTW